MDDTVTASPKQEEGEREKKPAMAAAGAVCSEAAEPAAAAKGCPATTTRGPPFYMTEEEIREILAQERKPLPWWLRMPRTPPADAARFESGQDRFMEYQAWVRKEYESKGLVRLPDDYYESLELIEAMCDAALFGTDDEPHHAEK